MYAFLAKKDFCSYAEYRNTSMPYSDLKVVGLNAKQVSARAFSLTKTDTFVFSYYQCTNFSAIIHFLQNLHLLKCERRCDDNNDGFLCRAYGIEYSNANVPTCFLHSEDTIGAGVSSLVTSPNSFFKEREPCIDSNFSTYDIFSDCKNCCINYFLNWQSVSHNFLR